MSNFLGSERFHLLAEIGEGSTGVVYEAQDAIRDERAAIKVLKNVNPNLLRRFKNEFRSLKQIHHPNLVRLDELFEERGTWFFSMEFVEGESIDQVLKEHTGDVDRERTRDVFTQLALGLHTIHQAGQAHRDVKPSNVIVTQAGRVVLLDFGLARDLTTTSQTSHHGPIGTLEYMAPEQCEGRSVGTEADLFSLGALLYEVLTGTKHADGSVLAIMQAKRSRSFARPEMIDPALPPDLCSLCWDLLDPEPSARPDGEEVLRRLGTSTGQAPAPSRWLQGQDGLFVGRERELESLMNGYEEIQVGGARGIILRGESGIGKSALLQQCLRALAQTRPPPLLLSGRCYQYEMYRFKAFDGAMEKLSYWLSDNEDVAQALPLSADSAWIRRVFPTMGDVPVFKRLPPVETHETDPIHFRTSFFCEMRDLFTQIACKQPIIFTVDDLQWADADSLALLREFLQPSRSMQMLFIGTVRSEACMDMEALASRGFDLEVLDLAPLRLEESRSLVTSLVERWPCSNHATERVIHEGKGHPLFLRELLRFAAEGDDTVPAQQISLNEAIQARFQKLPEPTQRVLQLAAISAGQVTQSALAQATNLNFGELSDCIRELQSDSLIRISGPDPGDVVEPYHDRIREAISRGLSPEEFQQAHRQLALAYESLSADAEILAHCWREAADPAKAGFYAIRSAENAIEQLAFERAALFYTMAIDTGVYSGGTKRDLLIQLGDTLASLGRGKEAVAAFEQAIPECNPSQALELTWKRASTLMQSGYFDQGLQALIPMLHELELTYPSSSLRALIELVWLRLRTRLLSLKAPPATAPSLSEFARMRIDACREVMRGLAMVDPVRGQVFQSRSLLYALQSGDPERIHLATTAELVNLAVNQPRAMKKRNALLARCTERARALEDPAATGIVDFHQAFALHVGGEFKSALELFNHAINTLSIHRSGASWLRATAIDLQLEALWACGEWKTLRSRAEWAIKEAESRGDLYLQLMVISSQFVLSELVEDDPDSARRSVREAISRWSTQGYHLQHYMYVRCMVYADLYEGRGVDAARRLDENWCKMRSAFLLRPAFLRIFMTSLRGSAAIASAVERGTRRRDLRSAGRAARQLERDCSRWSDPMAKLIRGGIATLQPKRRAEATRCFAEASVEFEELELMGWAAVAKRRWGQLEGGTLGETRVHQAEVWMTAQDVKNFDRICAMLAPGHFE